MRVSKRIPALRPNPVARATRLGPYSLARTPLATMPRRSFALAAAPPGHAALVAVFWMIGAAFFFSILSAVIRHLTGEMHPLEIAFFRNLFGLVFMLPWLAKAGFGSLRTGRFGLYLWRTTVGLMSMFAWFWALALLPFAQAVALSFTTPLFATMR